MVSNLDQQCKNYGMIISRDKTEVMVTSRESIQCDIELYGEMLKQVKGVYLLGKGDAKRMSNKVLKGCTGLFTNVHLYLGIKKSA